MIHYVLLVATALVVLFFIQTRALDVELHNKRIDLLLGIKQSEMALDRNITLARSFLLSQYDPFVETSIRIKQQLKLLSAENLLTSQPGKHRISDYLSDYQKMLEQKLRLIERIKSQSALLQNGLRYLPLAINTAELGNPELEGKLTRLLNDLFLYNLFSGELEIRNIQSKLANISSISGTHGVNSSKLDNILLHMRKTIEHIDNLQQLRDQYTLIPSLKRLDQLHQAYTELYTKQTRRSETYSLVLLLIAVTLFIALGTTMRRLARERKNSQQAWNQLRDAVESLSEAFALFAPDGKLVLSNNRYLEFYPWLKETLDANPTLDDVLRANATSGQLIEWFDEDESSPVAQPVLPCQENSTYVEQLKSGRWFLASDTCTSAGEMVCVRVDITDSKRNELELRKLYRALEQSPASVLITDTSGSIEYLNPKFEETTGYSADEVLGKNPRILKSGDKSREEYAELWKTITAGRVWRGQFHNRRKDGSIYWESASISPVRDSDGTITHFIAVKEDITARKRAEEQLRMNATVFETTTEAIMVTDSHNRIKTVNPSFTRITGYELEEVIGRNPSLLSSGRHDREFYNEMWHSLQTKGYWNGEIWNRKKDGSVYPEWLSLAAIRNERNDLHEYVAVFSDITRRKENEEQIRRQANYDALTGLPNRSLLVDRLSSSLKSAHRENWRVALLFIDLDRFKEVNDSLGHVAGDELLQIVAKRLTNSTREADTVARFGGDEFVVILEDIKHANDAAEIAKKILTAVEQPFWLNGREIFIGASIGVTLYPDDSSDADTMLRNADMAMYRAKESGRHNYQFFTLTMNEKVQQRIELERDLRIALDNGELDLYYQPIVCASSHRVTGVEALLRWHSPKRGLVPPDQFISLAEESGLIAAIGRRVLKAACSQAAAWQEDGLDLKVNVNISSRQVALGLEVVEIEQMLRQSGLDPSRLNLEITESLMMEGTESNQRWLSEVSALGVKLSIDDFGTGYSSLSYLKRFPVHTLKIDRSFVHGLPGDKEDASLVEAIIAMAKSLDLAVMAEGVETVEQLAFLREQGCEMVQGHLFSQALTADEIPAITKHPVTPKQVDVLLASDR